MKKINKTAFSMIEILVGIFIFSLGLVSVYALISSIIKLNDSNKHSLIAWYLANEQIEIIRNIRDTNYIKIQKYDHIDPNKNNFGDANSSFELWAYYKVQNNFSNNGSDYSGNLQKISAFWEWVAEINGAMQKYRLCMNEEKQYVYCLNNNGVEVINTKKTPFYKYVYFSEILDANWKVADWYKIHSRVIWYFRWYHEFYIDSIITDWKNL